MSPQAVVRAQARDILKHHYASAVIALITALLPAALIDSAAGVIVNGVIAASADADVLSVTEVAVILPLSIIAGVLATPLFNGYIRVFYRCALTGGMELGDLFYYFEKGRYSRTLVLNLLFVLRLLLPAALSFSPVLAYTIICAVMNNGFFGTVLYTDVYVILWILSSVILTLYALRYFTVFTLYAEDEASEYRELFRSSKRIMRSRTGSAAKLLFSYTPWMLLCLTVLPMLYVVPYLTQGLCIGAKWMTRAASEENQ